MVITDHLYLHGPGRMMYEISISKNASGEYVVNATPPGEPLPGATNIIPPGPEKGPGG